MTVSNSQKYNLGLSAIFDGKQSEPSTEGLSFMEAGGEGMPHLSGTNLKCTSSQEMESDNKKVVDKIQWHNSARRIETLTKTKFEVGPEKAPMEEWSNGLASWTAIQRISIYFNLFFVCERERSGEMWAGEAHWSSSETSNTRSIRIMPSLTFVITGKYTRFPKSARYCSERKNQKPNEPESSACLRMGSVSISIGVER